MNSRWIAELYQVAALAFNKHLKTILGNLELDAGATIGKFRIVQPEGAWQAFRFVDRYSLDIILAVGYLMELKYGE